MLDEEGHNLGQARVRVAVGRSGIALGFPRDPMLHISWWAFVALFALVGIRFIFRRRAA